VYFNISPNMTCCREAKATNETEIKVPKGSTRYDWGITRMASFSNVNGNNDDRELTLSEKLLWLWSFQTMNNNDN
jgi:hypothetical protein